MQQKQKQITKAQTMAYLGMLAAINIVLTRFLSIQTPIVRIGFGFIPYMLAAMLFGPWVGGAYGVITDFIGIMLFPTTGGYFPGFSISAFLGAFIYGMILYKKPKSVVRISLAVIIVTLFVDMFLNTLWLTIITGKSAYALLPPRAIKNSIMAVVKIVSMTAIWKYVGSYIENTFINKNTTNTTNVAH